MKTRDEYVAKLKSQLDRWNADMTQWETQAKAAQVDFKATYARQLQELQASQEKARYQLRLLEGASASAWQDLRRGAEEAWLQMDDALKAARTHFEKTH
jgi:hypothetical protein